MGLLSWIAIGAIVGWLSGQVMKSHGFGLLGGIFAGISGGLIAGGLIGGWLAGLLFKAPDAGNGINEASILVAVVFIAASRMVEGRGRTSLQKH